MRLAILRSARFVGQVLFSFRVAFTAVEVFLAGHKTPGISSPKLRASGDPPISLPQLMKRLKSASQGMILAVCQIPEKSGLPSASRSARRCQVRRAISFSRHTGGWIVHPLAEAHYRQAEQCDRRENLHMQNHRTHIV